MIHVHMLVKCERTRIHKISNLIENSGGRICDLGLNIWNISWGKKTESELELVDTCCE